MRGVLWGLAALIFAIGGVYVWMESTQTFDPRPCLPRGVSSPILALELVRTLDELEAILGLPLGARNRQVIRGQIREDWVFIACYGTLFAGLGFVGSRSRRRVARVLANVAVATTLGAVVFDVLENRAILQAVDRPRSELTDAHALAIRHPSLVKWVLIFATTVLLAPTFLGWRGEDPWVPWFSRPSGALLAASGLIGEFGFGDPRPIGLASAVLTLALLLLAALFVARGGPFLRGL